MDASATTDAILAPGNLAATQWGIDTAQGGSEAPRSRPLDEPHRLETRMIC